MMKFDLRNVAIGASLFAAILMLVGKITAFAITDSAAIFSDAAESVVHIFATGIAAFSLWYSRRPADYNHPYGHGKIAYFSAGFEGALISIAGLGVMVIAVEGFIRGPELRQLGVGLSITFVLALINLALGSFLVYVGKRENALVLVANGKHVLTDMWTSFGVIAGVGIVHFTGIVWLDPAVAFVLGLHILREALKLIRQAYGGLLDEVDAETSEQIVDVFKQAVTDGLIEQFHQLRHRISNDILWIEVHALLPDDMTNRDCHERATRLEEEIRAHFPKFKVQMTVHTEPVNHLEAHPDGHVFTSPLPGNDP